MQRRRGIRTHAFSKRQGNVKLPQDISYVLQVPLPTVSTYLKLAALFFALSGIASLARVAGASSHSALLGPSTGPIGWVPFALHPGQTESKVSSKTYGTDSTERRLQTSG